MIGNTLLDSVIAQAQKRNAEIQAQNQARIASLPTSVAPIVNPILDNLAGGGSLEGAQYSTYNDPFYQADFNTITAANPMGNGQAVMDQRAYDQAVAFNNPTSTLGKIGKAMTPALISVPMGIMADQTMKAAQNNPNVVQDTAAKLSGLGRLTGQTTGVPSGIQSWGRAQKDNAPMKAEIDNAWHAMRAKFMNAEAKEEQDRADIEGMGGFGGVQQGMTAANFGETAGDMVDAFSAPSDDGGGYDGGFGDADAMGGDMDASSFGVGDDGGFGGYA